MMEKKRMAALLAAVLFGMSAIPAGAVNLIDTDAAATDSAEHAELDLYGVRATVTDRQDGELTVSTETAGTVVVHIAEQTIIMDTQTGLPAGAQDIKKGDEVYLYCGEMMALSEPPQVYAKAILVNLTDEHEPASLLSAEQVKRNADGSLTVQASDGGLTLNIVRNASVTARKTRQNLRTSAWEPGFLHGMIRFWNPIRHRRARTRLCCCRARTIRSPSSLRAIWSLAKAA